LCHRLFPLFGGPIVKWMGVQVPSRIKHVFTRTPLALSGGLVFLLATTAVNVAHFLYHVVVSRNLDLGSYGALGALLGIMLIFAVPAGALQVTVIKEVASQRAANADSIAIGPLLRQSALAGIATMLLLLAASPLIVTFLDLDSSLAAVLLALYAIPSALAVVPRGVLLGESRYRLVSGALLAGALTRLALGAVLSSSIGLVGAMAAIVIGDLIAVGAMLPAVRRVLDTSASPPVTFRWRHGITALLAFSGFWALAGVDTLLARFFFTPDVSGLYAAAATAARAALFLPAAAAAIAFPHFAIDRGKGDESRRALMRCLAFVALLGSVAAALLITFDQFAVTVLFGDKYLGAVAAVTPLALSSVVLGLVSVFVHFHIASNARMVAAFPWIGAGAAAVGITLFHDSLFEVALVMFVVALVLLAVMANVAFTRPVQRRGHNNWLGKQMWSAERPTIDLTVVVPYFNPGPGVVSTIERLHEALSSAEVTYEIIAVSDGSTDGSDELLEALNIANLRLVNIDRNTGKGHALRLGLSMGKGEYLGFIDADGDVDPRILAPYLSLVRLYNPDIVLGSKRHPMSEVHYPPLRHVYSWGYQMLTYAMFRTKVRDTQTGLKLIRREVLAVVLPVMMEKRFAFDLELLVVAKHLGFSKFFEAPIKIDHQFTSTISTRAVRGMMRDTLAIYYRLHMLRSYDISDDAPQAPWS
jgi:O-antigen/teichoic acid export membrane protein